MAMALLPGCAKINVFTEPPDNPVVDSLSPASGRIGTQIRLWGSGFSTFTSKDTVRINGILLRVDTPSTSTVILATIIDSTGTGPVKVSVNGRTIVGPIFTYLGGSSNPNQPAPVISKVTRGWADGVGYALNVNSLPANDADIHLFVGGVEIRVDDVVRPGSSSYDPAVGLQVRTSEEDNVYKNAVDIYANFQVTFSGVPSNSFPFQLLPFIDDIVSRHGEYAFAIGDTITITGKALGHRTLPSSILLVYNGLPLQQPTVVSWANNEIKAVMPAYPSVPLNGTFPLDLLVGDRTTNRNLGVRYLGAISGTVTLIAGNGLPGNTNGHGAAASFNNAAGVALDAQGNLYVADRDNNTIRKISNITASGGDVTTLAGSGVAGYREGTGTTAQFSQPTGLAIDELNNLYVADFANHRIRIINTSNGIVDTYSGDGSTSFYAYPAGLATNNHNLIYVASAGNHHIIRILNVSIFPFAGSTQGYTDGTGTAAKFNQPYGVAIDANGTVYVADEQNHAIRKITSAGVVTTLAGGTEGTTDGTGSAAKFVLPHALTIDAQGNLYVADFNNSHIRKVTQQGVVTSLTGQFADGTPSGFIAPNGITIDAQGALYISDAGTNNIYKYIP